MQVELKPGERIDDLERNNLKIIQNKERFCFGMDAVLLSGFANVKEGEKALDIGTGTGIIPILLSAKTKGEHFTALEIMEESAEMARRSVKLNDLEDKIEIITGDAKKATEIFGKRSFDVVTSNPPYMTADHGLKNPDEAKAVARHEVYLTLEELIAQTASVITEHGRFYMVHRPFRLAEIIDTLRKYKLEPKRMRFVHPFIDKEPNMVLIESVYGANQRVTIEPPLIVYESEGKYTQEIYDVYGY